MKPSKKTIYEYFRDFALARPDDKFLFDENVCYTVFDTFRLICSFASKMSALGISAGKKVAVRATRSVKTIISFFALQFIGAIAVLFDPREKLPQYEFVLFEDKLCGPEFNVDLFSCKETCFTPVSDSTANTVTIFTSGSTDTPKTVELSQYNFINNSLDTAYIGGYASDDINIDIVPIHHVFGLALIFTAVVTQHCIFVPEHLDADYIVRSIIKYRVTRLNGVPSLYLSMARSPLVAGISTLRYGLIGGAPCSKEQFYEIESKTGITLIPVYGMSECVGISCGSFNDSFEQRRTSVGRTYSMNEVKIAGDGEILVKSPAMAKGAVVEDGWLHTGDLGFFDKSGYLHINGRKKDIIIRNGNNLSAVAIEQKILKIQGVKDVCVVGVADEREGEVPAAMIVLSDGVLLSDVKKSLCNVMVKNEFPKHVICARSIPLTSSCKPDKQIIKKLFPI